MWATPEKYFEKFLLQKTWDLVDTGKMPKGLERVFFLGFASDSEEQSQTDSQNFCCELMDSCSMEVEGL
jgi:hypothetical protein